MYYGSEYFSKECPCTHKTSTPVRPDFDLYEDIIFVPANHLDEDDKVRDEAFIKDDTIDTIVTCTYHQKQCVFPRKIRKTFKQAKRKSKKGAKAALTLILCNIL